MHARKSMLAISFFLTALVLSVTTAEPEWQPPGQKNRRRSRRSGRAPRWRG